MKAKKIIVGYDRSADARAAAAWALDEAARTGALVKSQHLLRHSACAVAVVREVSAS